MCHSFGVFSVPQQGQCHIVWRSSPSVQPASTLQEVVIAWTLASRRKRELCEQGRLRLWAGSDSWVEANETPGAKRYGRGVERLLRSWVLESRAQAGKLIRLALMVLLVLICSWNKDTHQIQRNQNVIAC